LVSDLSLISAFSVTNKALNSNALNKLPPLLSLKSMIRFNGAFLLIDWICSNAFIDEKSSSNELIFIAIKFEIGFTVTLQKICIEKIIMNESSLNKFKETC